MGEPEPIITPESSGSPVSAPFSFDDPKPRKLRWYQVLESELTNLTTGGLWFNFHLALFTLIAGAFITLGITLLTVQLDETLKPIFVAVELAFLVLLVYFAGSTAILFRRNQGKIRDITQRRT